MKLLHPKTLAVLSSTATIASILFAVTGAQVSADTTEQNNQSNTSNVVGKQSTTSTSGTSSVEVVTASSQSKVSADSSKDTVAQSTDKTVDNQKVDVTTPKSDAPSSSQSSVTAPTVDNDTSKTVDKTGETQDTKASNAVVTPAGTPTTTNDKSVTEEPTQKTDTPNGNDTGKDTVKAPDDAKPAINSDNTDKAQSADKSNTQPEKVSPARAIESPSTPDTGWANDNGHVKYRQDGKFVTGEKKINGYWYNFDQNQIMSTGMTKLPSKTVYYDKDSGKMIYGYIWLNGTWSYANDYDGHLTTGLRRYGDNQIEYYGNDFRQVRNSYVWSNGSFYFVNEHGDAITGARPYGNGKLEFYGDDHKQVRNNYAQDKDGATYYLTGNGDALKGTRQSANGLEYYGDDYKQVKNNYVWANGGIYFFDQNGKAINGVRYYGNRNMEFYGNDGKQIRNSYIRTGNTYYYLTGNGDAQKGLRRYGSASYQVEYYGDDFKQYRNNSVTVNHTQYHFGWNGDADYIVPVDENGNPTSQFKVGDKVYITKNALQTVGGNGDLTNLQGQQVVIMSAKQQSYSRSNWQYTIKLSNGRIINNALEQDLQVSPVQFHVDMNQAINWFESRKGKITYSMYGSRNGSDGTADCSGSVTQALRDSGASPYAYLYSTESLHDYLTANGFKLIAQNPYYGWNAQRGDIVIWGQRGYSEGAGGHVGIITSTENDPYFISTCYLTQGQQGTAVQEVRYNEFAQRDNYPYYYVYRQA